MQKYPGAFTLLGISLSHYLLFPDFWDNLTFVRFGGYTIIIASPKLKNRYLSLTASSYAASTCSLPASALTSMISVDSGKWKFVIRQSTTWNVLPGSRKSDVLAPSRAVISPASASQALSRLRTLVVPTAMTRPPHARAS